MHDQRSQAWYEMRLGKVTASRVMDVMTGTAEKRRTYMMQLAAERLTGAPVETGFMSEAMRRGVELEDIARVLFTLETNIEVEETGFHLDPFIPHLGASPDGLTSDGGILEIKCPNSATHLTYCKDRKVPSKYLAQVQCQMAVTQASHGYFVSYDDRFPPRLQIFWIRVERDDAYIKEMRAKIESFLEELEDFIINL